eukprot:g5882.t1
MSFSEMMQQAIQIRTSTDAKLRVDFDSRPKFQQSSMFATHEAIQIRTSTDAKLRVDFDSRPKFQQSSMFATHEVRDARGLALEERLAVCKAMKLRGNAQMCIGNYDEACQIYEQALAIFWYLDNRNDSWKTSGIKDEDITEINFCPASGVQGSDNETRDLKVALLLNIARAYSAKNDYTTSSKACGAALATNPSCAKALYLRGKALVTPASAGALETEEAIRDVSRAADLAPGDAVIRAFLSNLMAERARQKEVDRATFAGMFDRGSVCDPETESKTGPLPAPTHGVGNAERGVFQSEEAGEGGQAPPEGSAGKGLEYVHSKSDNNGNGAVDHAGGEGSGGESRGEKALEMRRDVEERVAFFKGLVRECDEEGREEEANNFRERVEAIEEVLAEHDRQEKERVAGLKNYAQVDWRNPSEAMRKKATEEEYDLDNPAVISFLIKMQEDHKAKLQMQRSDSKRDDGDYGSEMRESRQSDDGCGGANKSTEATSFDTFFPRVATQDNWTEEVWEGAILCMTRPEVTSLLSEELGIDPDPEATLRELRSLAVTKRADWKITAAISLFLFVFKAYQMGLLKWMIAAGNPAAGTVSAPTGASFRAKSGNRAGHRAEAERGRRGRRGWERRSPSSAVDARSGENTADADADFDGSGSSLAAQVLASAVQTAAPPLEESLAGWCDSSVEGACEAGGTQ